MKQKEEINNNPGFLAYKNLSGCNLSKLAHRILPSIINSATAFAVPGALHIPYKPNTPSAFLSHNPSIS